MSQKRGFCLQQCAADQQAGPEHKRRCKAMTATQSHFIGDSGVIKRVEYIRILQQALTELGYSQLADGLAEASNCLCEAPSVVYLRQHIVNGAWLPACEAAEACTELTTDQLSRVKYVLMQQHVLEVCDWHMYFTAFLSMSTAHASPAWFSMCTGPSAPSRAGEEFMLCFHNLIWCRVSLLSSIQQLYSAFERRCSHWGFVEQSYTNSRDASCVKTQQSS